MGRNSRQTADYFPHYIAGKSRTKFILEKNWGNDGYAFWFKLLELLCAADGQYYDCWSTMNWEYLLAVTGVDAETAENILKTLSEMGKVDRELWETCRVIWVQSLLENLSQLYSKRTTTPEKPSIDAFPRRKQPNDGISAPEIAKPEEKQPENGETPAEKPKGRRRRASELSAKQLALFERFYKAYPKKVDRATAEKAWAKIAPEPDEAMTDAIIRAVEDAKKFDSRFRERQFTPNPASWLNAKAYLNDYSQGGEQRGEVERYSGFTPSSGFKPTDDFKPTDGS